MHPSLRVANAHKPLIRFLGKRQWPAKPEEQHPHPFAPSELKQHFSDFVKKFQSASSTGPAPSKNSSSSGNAQVFEEFWQAPARFWKRDLEDWEIDLVHSGGASAKQR
ncbi:hypothetical protein C8Q80DRAFT_592450 [Daedaleopsis nitida]|nr:hypothetical protein C8Q80DRAFT_592450 [Daedaleopsis nitida]